MQQCQSEMMPYNVVITMWNNYYYYSPIITTRVSQIIGSNFVLILINDHHANDRA